MADEVISLRVGKEMRQQMRMHPHINWSALTRRALIQELDRMHTIDKKKALEAAADMDKIRKSCVFDGGKTGAQIIREWRDKRR